LNTLKYPKSGAAFYLFISEDSVPAQKSITLIFFESCVSHFTSDISFVVMFSFIIDYWLFLIRSCPSGDETFASVTKEQE